MLRTGFGRIGRTRLLLEATGGDESHFVSGINNAQLDCFVHGWRGKATGCSSPLGMYWIVTTLERQSPFDHVTKSHGEISG